MSEEYTFALRGVSKQYRTGTGVKLPWNRSSGAQVVDAVDNVTLVTRPGESIGLIGRNGSGKSTLMRLMAGVERPTSGVVLSSAVPQLLGVSAALQPLLSGRENIRLGYLALGLPIEGVEEAVKDVAEFTELENALDRPMGTYSSGMAARLKFGIATFASPKILLVDEALATGDAAFNQRAQERMGAMLQRTGTLILVSHSVHQIMENCSRAVWLDSGRIISDGPVARVTNLYRNWSRRINSGDYADAGKILETTLSEYSPPAIYFDHELSDPAVWER